MSDGEAHPNVPDRTLDDLDRRILYELQREARRTSTTEIAEACDVSPSTVRNRIRQLEADGIIRGSHVDVDYEAIGYQLYTLIFCTAPIPEREELAREARQVPGVVHVREIMTGEENLHVVAVGEDGDDLSRIGRELDALGLTIEDEDIIRREYVIPYEGFAGETSDGE